MRTTGSSTVEGYLVDWVRTRPEPGPRLPVAWLDDTQVAAELQQLARDRARNAAREAELILRFAALRPDDDDPAPGTAGARRRDAWSADPQTPGVSEFFTSELGSVLNCGHGTAAWRARRARTWRDSLPATFAALERGQIDERRAQELFDALEHTDPALARRVDAAILPEATSLTLRELRRRALELLLELDPARADENRELASKAADVFVQPRAEGVATLGADLPADQAAEAYDLINQLATMAKQDGDPRPIAAIRTEIFSLLLRRPGGTGLPGVRANLTITAALDSLEGTATAPGDVAGFAITPAHLRDLLRRVGALGLATPEDGSLTFALTDADGRLLATVTKQQLERLVRRGCPDHPTGECGCPILDRPPPTDAYEPTDDQRIFIRTRDRTCRFPNCGQRIGWADLDHVIAHACGGETGCANLCCFCRLHHRLKTFAPGWRFVMDPDGTLHVTTPSGTTRTVRPPGLRPPPPSEPEPPPPAEPDPPPDDDLPPF
jgi:hypothetical protein